MTVRKSHTLALAAAAVSLVGALAGEARADAFGVGNLTVFDAVSTGAPGNTGSAINILEINPTGSGSLVQTLTAPSLYASASASSNGLLRLSNNGTTLAFTGHTALPASSTANVNTVLTRGVGTFDSTGTYALATTYTGGSGNQTRSAVTTDGVNYYIGDQGGIYRNGATANSSSANVRDMQVFGNNIYTATASAINSISPNTTASSGALTLTPFTVSGTALSNVNDFIFVSSTGGSTPDTLYVSTTSGTNSIVKYAVSGTTLTSQGSFAVTGGVYGLTAGKVANAFNLYYTTGSGAAAANSVATVTDTGLAGSASFGSATTLFTGSANDVLKGIDFAPVAAPEPASLALVGLAVAPLLGQRRRRR